MTRAEYRELCRWSFRLVRAWHVCRKPDGSVVVRLAIPKGAVELFELLGHEIIDTREKGKTNAKSVPLP